MSAAYPREKRNLIAFGMDYVFFALSMGFMNLNTVLPVFAAQLGAAPNVIGLVLSMMLVLWTLPQVIAGNVSSRYEHKKPLMMRIVLGGRPLTLLVPIIILITGARPAWLMLIITFAVYSGFFLTDAFAAVPWFDLFSRAFPPEKRGGYISWWQIIKSLFLLGVSALVGFILSVNGPPFPTNFVLLFFAASGCLAVSAYGLSLIHEVPEQEDQPAATNIAWRDFAHHLSRLWKADQRFRRLSLARVTYGLALMASPFYVIYATEELHFPTGTIGLFIFAQTIGTSFASLILGRVADRHGAARVIRLGTGIVLTAPLIALAMALAGESLTSLLSRAYLWIYVCVGLADNMMMIGFMNYLMDISLPGQRSFYMGTFSAVGTLAVLGPVIAGEILSLTSYPVLFAVASLLSVGAFLMTLRLPRARQVQPLPHTEITTEAQVGREL